jgi:ubiquinone/menaquinone biosynthesis C-methylase UbiE
VGLYTRYVLPKIVHLVCSAEPTMRQRQKVVPRASGLVLEVGLGSGLNLPLYDPARVTKVYGLEPSPAMRRMAAAAIESAAVDVELIDGSAEEIPLADASVETVLVTYTLCTIPDAAQALREMARVLAPGGRLLFCEHGLADDPAVRTWQGRLTPVWTRLGGGCHLDRDIPALIERGGFRIQAIDTMYLPGWRPASFNYWGMAGLR